MEPISGWGLDGWGLGSCPLVVVYQRGDSELAIDVEGDITVETFSRREERHRRIDETSFSYWRNHDEEWVKGINSHEHMPANLRGPFSWKRLEEQRTVRD